MSNYSDIACDQVVDIVESGDDSDRKFAGAYLSPKVQAAVTALDYQRDLCDFDLMELVEKLHEQVEAVQAGDLSRIDEMLLSQAHTLDRLFNTLLQDAARAGRASLIDLYLKLGLRAQNQCRTTLEALVAMRQGPRSVSFVGQNNIAGVQQVKTNASRDKAPITHAGEILRNKLMEKDDEQRLDTGKAGAPGRADSTMETVAPLYRANVG